MSAFEIEISAAEQLDTVHALIARLVYRPRYSQPFDPDSFPSALLRAVREELRNYLNRFPLLVRLNLVARAWRAYRRAALRM